MALREYDFIVGPETSTLPTVGTPTVDSDIITKGYADDTYTAKAEVYGSVSDITALKAIGTSVRFDEQIVWVSGKEAWYEFDDSSVATPDDDLVVQPNTGTGRWLKKVGGGTGGGGSGSGIDTLKQKLDNEYYDIISSPIDNSVGSGFSMSAPTLVGRLLEDYASGTTLRICWNPTYASDSDKNFDATTGWAVQGAGASLATSGTHKIGTASLSFDKNNTGTNARIRYDVGAATRSIVENTDMFFWINLPSLTNFSNVEVRIDVDGTNYQTYTATTDHTGTALATGWNLMKFDLTAAGSTSGTGWDRTKLFRYIHIGVNTSSGAQTYTAILVDALHFSARNVGRLVQVGNKYTMYDTSDLDYFIISSSSPRLAGEITITGGMSSAFDGGTDSTAARNTLTIVGNNLATMTQSLSGGIADTQEVRLQRILPETLSAQNFKAFARLNTNCVFEVTGVTDSDTITVSDPVDQSLNLVSGKIIHTFRPYYNADGVANYVNMELDLTIASSSHSTGTTTINTGTNTGIAVGDFVVLKHPTVKVSLAAIAANESYSSLTEDSVILVDRGVAYPNPQSIYGHWLLGGQTDAVAQSLQFGSGVGFSKTGSPNLQSSFLNGRYSATAINDSNYLNISNPSVIAGNVTNALQISFWFYAAAFTGTRRVLIDKQSGPVTGNGWGIWLESSTNTLRFSTDTSGGTIGTYSPNTWQHCVLVMLSAGATSYGYLNAVKGSTLSGGISSNTANLTIGKVNGGSGYSDTSTKFADLIIWLNGAELTQGEIESLYNRGQHRIVGFGPMMEYNYSVNGLSGQKISLEGTLARTTDTAVAYFTNAGAMKS